MNRYPYLLITLLLLSCSRKPHLERTEYVINYPQSGTPTYHLNTVETTDRHGRRLIEKHYGARGTVRAFPDSSDLSLANYFDYSRTSDSIFSFYTARGRWRKTVNYTGYHGGGTGRVVVRRIRRDLKGRPCLIYTLDDARPTHVRYRYHGKRIVIRSKEEERAEEYSSAKSRNGDTILRYHKKKGEYILYEKEFGNDTCRCSLSYHSDTVADSYCSYGREDKPTHTVFLRGSDRMVTRFFYDPSGRLSEQHHFSNDTLTHTCCYTYRLLHGPQTTYPSLPDDSCRCISEGRARQIIRTRPEL